MISFLRGRIVSTGIDHVVIDLGGIGYKVFVPTTVISKAVDSQMEITLHTYLHVREDAMQLFGFKAESDRGIFELLLQVSGIGPRLALAVLSAVTVPSLVQAVINEQVNVLTQIPGVGKKMAQRVIVELKDKFAKIDIGDDSGITEIVPGSEDTAGDAMQALAALGYHPAEAKKALAKVASGNKGLALEEIVRLALKELGR
ncbi:Holliday junction branch migration protein RuvA [Phosphitispora sp. TUW77]|uniref:Holliday junction branch migration protein RuvA n=1 Tax=Phosphitispora sp. TUW77 TaxID=3152361 RepID=UPI003AB45361